MATTSAIASQGWPLVVACALLVETKPASSYAVMAFCHIIVLFNFRLLNQLPSQLMQFQLKRIWLPSQQLDNCQKASSG
jgi:hypothetical protein